MRLLLIEDDPMIGAALQKGLQQEGHAVDWVRDGDAADRALAAEPYALAVLDLGLPGRDGLAVLAGLRRRGNVVPVIIATARDGRADVVRGLDLGADDYVVKPFDLEELAARIRAVLRRHAGRAASRVTHGALEVDLGTREVLCRGRRVELSAREFALLAALLERPGAVLSRAQLEERLYGWGEEVASNAVEVHIHHLRRKLGEGVIRNVRGVGYTLSAGR
ncbi:MAG: response regulator [Gammaproteobacteria bacterium]